MRRRALLAVWLLVGAEPLVAGALEKSLQARWNDAWVVLKVGVRSDCETSYTNNTVAGRRTVGLGAYPLDAGELGRVRKVDLKRSRLDLLVDLQEPYLASRTEGPFVLFDQAHCRVELMVDVPRELVRGKKLEDLDATLRRVATPFGTRAEARGSGAWNGRRVELPPEGYEETLVQYEEWKREKVEERIREVLRRAVRLTDRAGSNEMYAEGMGQGLQSFSRSFSSDCGSVLDASYYPGGGSPPAEYDSSDKKRWRDGYKDGLRLAFYVELAWRLAECLE